MFTRIFSKNFVIRLKKCIFFFDITYKELHTIALKKMFFLLKFFFCNYLYLHNHERNKIKMLPQIILLTHYYTPKEKGLYKIFVKGKIKSTKLPVAQNNKNDNKNLFQFN